MYNNCKVCNQVAVVTEIMNPDVFDIVCDRCGEYSVTGSLMASNIEDTPNLFLLSGVLRNAHERGTKLTLTTTNIETLIQSNQRKENPHDAAIQLVEYIARKSVSPGEFVEIKPLNDFSVVYSKSVEEFTFYLEAAKTMGLLEGHDTYYMFRVSLRGWETISTTNIAEKLEQAFVAMWFDSQMAESWENGFKAAIKECGFNALRIDQVEHNEKICDKILSEIKKSHFLVADFTGQRPGVYFEAGFALALGKEVIWTCRSTDIDGLHFDTRQYNHLVWENEEDLKEKLEARIMAVVV